MCCRVAQYPVIKQVLLCLKVEFSLGLGLLNFGSLVLDFGPAAPAVDRSDSDVGSEHEPSVISPSDAEIRMCLTEVFDGPIREGRRIRCLQHVSFAYKARDPTMSADTTSGPADSQVSIVDVIEFAHGGESILDTIMFFPWLRRSLAEAPLVAPASTCLRRPPQPGAPQPVSV